VQLGFISRGQRHRIQFYLKMEGTPSKFPSKEMILRAFALCFTVEIITRICEEQLFGGFSRMETKSIPSHIDVLTEERGFLDFIL